MTANKRAAALIDKLDGEALRFTDLAKDAALKCLTNHGNTEHGALARNHLIRAETYKDAARIASCLLTN